MFCNSTGYPQRGETQVGHVLRIMNIQSLLWEPSCYSASLNGFIYANIDLFFSTLGMHCK